MSEDWRIIADVCTVQATLISLVIGLLPIQRPGRSKPKWLADKRNEASVRGGERLFLGYSVVWIAAAIIVIAFRLYESFDRWGYLLFCAGCALPLPLMALLGWPNTEDKGRRLSARYSVKANAWLALFSFAGNYWYTHYFYHVLGAWYSFDAHRLNNVPIPLYFMTHPYFSLYHTVARMCLRRARSRFAPGWQRVALEASIVLALSYLCAAAEAITIAGFPYYGFRNRRLAISVGSFFYGVYFLVSFPAFSRIDADSRRPHSLFRAMVEAAAASFLVLQMLDFTRLALGQPLFRTPPSG